MGTNKNKTKKLMKLLIATAAMMVAAQAKFVFKGWKPHGKLSECQGDCDSNRECGAGLYCQHDHRGYVRGHNCGSRGRKYADYCVRRANSSHYTFFGWHTRGRLGRCQGDCDSNKDCRRGLRCAQTNGYARGNGCRGRSHKKAADYCVRARPANSRNVTFFGWKPRGTLGRCQGDCDRNKECRGSDVCIQTNGYFRGYGCRGRSHKKAADYCVGCGHYMMRRYHKYFMAYMRKLKAARGAKAKHHVVSTMCRAGRRAAHAHRCSRA